MAQSGGLGFGPVLHNITPEKVVFCYRDGDADSLEVATYYRSKRGIPENHLIPLPCTNDLYISESQYESQIEIPLINQLTALGEDVSSSGQREIWVIILGYNVPIAFYGSESEYLDPYDPGNLIAVASRLHRLGRERENQYPNPTYDRRVFKYFDADDSDSVYLTAIINGPTKHAAKKLIDRSVVVDNLTFVTGKVFVDPYGKSDTDAQLQYQADMLDFIEKELPNLGLESQQTQETIDGSDPFITSMAHDSFYFGWFTPRYSKSLFLNQNEKRVFLYNADSDAAAQINEPLHDNTSDPWCNLAINVEPGYAVTAGAVADPDENSYLRPRPFFETLHHGATIGEAFLFASPVVDWRIILIGDPLLVVNFPLDLPDSQNPSNTLIANNECIRRIKEAIEESLAYGRRQSRLLDDVVNKVLLSTDITEEINLLYQTTGWRDQKNASAQNDLLGRAVDAFLTYILRTEGLTFEEWLEANNEKTTEFLNNLLATTLAQGSVDEDFVHEEGNWNYDFSYNHVRNVLENVHFQIQVSLDENFESAAVDESSYLDEDGWKREVEPNVFTPLPSSGFPSNFSGRRVRFVSNKSTHVLTRTELYYVRWRPLDRNGVPMGDWTESTNPMIIKR